MIQAEIRAVQVQSVYWIPERHYVPSPLLLLSVSYLTHSLYLSLLLPHALSQYPSLSAVVVVICLFDWTN